MLSGESKKVLADYFAGQPHVDAAFLFGSQALGTAHAGSDVDIAVLLKRDAPDNPRMRLKFTNELMDLLGRNEVDVVIVNDAPPLLAFRVARDGVVLFRTSNPVVSDFALRSVQQYEDTKPLRDLQAKQASRIFREVGRSPDERN